MKEIIFFIGFLLTVPAVLAIVIAIPSGIVWMIIRSIRTKDWPEALFAIILGMALVGCILMEVSNQIAK